MVLQFFAFNELGTCSRVSQKKPGERSWKQQWFKVMVKGRQGPWEGRRKRDPSPSGGAWPWWWEGCPPLGQEEQGIWELIAESWETSFLMASIFLAKQEVGVLCGGRSKKAKLSSYQFRGGRVACASFPWLSCLCFLTAQNLKTRQGWFNSLCQVPPKAIPACDWRMKGFPMIYVIKNRNIKQAHNLIQYI